jgi:hypothetical protein
MPVQPRRDPKTDLQTVSPATLSHLMRGAPDLDTPPRTHRPPVDLRVRIARLVAGIVVAALLVSFAWRVGRLLVRVLLP